VLTVRPDDAAATGSGDGVAVQVGLTAEVARHVLAVPISALLALAGGGYGVEIAGARRTTHLVGVRTGIFTGSEVQIAGRGLRAGLRVVVAQ
jgi:hypothetical protein